MKALRNDLLDSLLRSIRLAETEVSDLWQLYWSTKYHDYEKSLGRLENMVLSGTISEDSAMKLCQKIKELQVKYRKEQS